MSKDIKQAVNRRLKLAQTTNNLTHLSLPYDQPTKINIKGIYKTKGVMPIYTFNFSCILASFQNTPDVWTLPKSDNLLIWRQAGGKPLELSFALTIQQHEPVLKWLEW